MASIMNGNVEPIDVGDVEAGRAKEIYHRSKRDGLIP
jgi:hypothetical protein